MEERVRLEHSLANLNVLLPNMWRKLADDDKWGVDTTFAELSNVGNRPTALAGVRKALLKVQGFDFVPENLRSNSFKRAAQAVLTAHHTFGNFYAEPEPTKQLARMGTSIPGPALAECLRAYLSVFLGNAYSHSWDAASIAERELKKVSRDRWELYLSKIFPAEQDLLFKLNEAKPLKRWTELVAALGLAQYAIAQSLVAKLIEASARQSLTGVTQHATALLRQFRGG